MYLKEKHCEMGKESILQIVKSGYDKNVVKLSDFSGTVHADISPIQKCFFYQ
jgi:hypothetical protein